MHALWAGTAWAGALVMIPAGSYEPLYPADPDQPKVRVEAFELYDAPVTGREFAAFVRDHPEWAPANVSPLMADTRYLAHPTEGEQPATQVSWFAARAFCAARGERLPTVDEWEYTARASSSEADASRDPERLQELLAWYSQPSTGEIGEIRQRLPNVYGVYDMHGLVWEWVEDFNRTLFGTDGRQGGDDDDLRFCGAGALSATDVTDYTRFMRVAFRSALEGSYTTINLGFRCAKDVEAR